MDNLTREQLLAYKEEVESARQNIADEFQRLTGAIQFIDAVLADMDARQAETEKQVEGEQP
ncbi:MAG: hypothetical protein LC114_17850 [Bryobacterales bacterium]|nr:hypothetical protein [Bryobacterales bacterium]